MISLKELLAQIKGLNPMPAVSGQLLTAVNKPDSSMEEISQLIQYDPVMTANVLKRCNSAYFGLKYPVESIKHAASMLGTDQLVEVALMESGAKALSGRQDGYGLDDGDMWRQAVSSAVLAKLVSKRLGLSSTSMVFTSALLKDIGKIILEQYVKEDARTISELVAQKKMSFPEAEKQVLGISHAELGAMIAKTWNFSTRMVNIIRYHHLTEITPDMSEKVDKELLAVYLADCICMMIGIGVGADGLSYRFKDEIIEQAGLGPEDISLIIADFGSNMQEIEELFNLK